MLGPTIAAPYQGRLGFGDQFFPGAILTTNVIEYLAQNGNFQPAMWQLLHNAAPERPCADVDRIAQAHLHAVEARNAKLTALRAEPRRMLKECGKGQIAECRVIESLSNQKLCKARRH